ncbi:MAG: hypothetical protein FJ317_09700 [SAR202 cluster bacterium]|nr:hypothetical protein [SAR202 cluster bacterium]
MAHARTHARLSGRDDGALDWSIRGARWDERMECYVAEVHARPPGERTAVPAVWEYRLDASLLPLQGFPVLVEVPEWGASDGAAASGLSAALVKPKTLWALGLGLAGILLALTVAGVLLLATAPAGN